MCIRDSLLTDSQIRTLLEQQQVEKWNADDLVDVIEMQAYVFLCKQFNLSNEDKINLILSNIKNSLRIDTVSYTHLDVYKRQILSSDAI